MNPSLRHQTMFRFAIIYDDTNHGRGIIEKESLKKSYCAGNMEGESLRMSMGEPQRIH